MKKIELSETQRTDATAYIFTAFEIEMKKKDTKITEDDYQYTYTGSIDSDADAMYVVMKKHNLTLKLDEILSEIQVLEYFQELFKK